MNVLLVSAEPSLHAAFARALERTEPKAQLTVAASLEQVHGPLQAGVDLVFVDVTLELLSPARWAVLLRGAEVPALLVAVCPAGDETQAVQWLLGGAADWVHAPDFADLRPLLLRLARELLGRRRDRLTQGRLQRAALELLQLARSENFRGDKLGPALRELTEAGARALGVDRCAVWVYEPGTHQLQVSDLFVRGTQQHSRGGRLDLAAYPVYAEAIQRQQLVSTSSVRHDPRTSALWAPYFEPTGVVSTLDVAVRLRGDFVGCLCLESVKVERQWTADEEVFARSLADMVSLALEAAERHLAEAQLDTAERRFLDVVESTSDLVVVYRLGAGDAATVEAANPAAKVLAEQPLVGAALSAVVPTELANTLTSALRKAAAGEGSATYAHMLQLNSGERRWLHTVLVPLKPDGEVRRVAALSRDLTAERLRLENRADGEKFEAVGRVAQRVVHDFNNVLAAVSAHAQRLKLKVPGAAESAENILTAVERASELSRQVVSFRPSEALVRRKVDLAEVAREVLALLEPQVGAAATLKLEPPQAPAVVGGDGSQLHRLMLNLVQNALHAVEGGGAVTVRLEALTLSEDEALQHPPLRAGPHVKLSVVDTGVGMTEETRRHLFEPFFTTRGGNGTGLGLAVVQGVVLEHGGAISVETRPRGGARFSVWLPAWAAPEGTSAPLAPRPRGAARGSVLVVDDQKNLADTTASVLRLYGFEALSAHDAQGALAALSAHRVSVALVDYHLPPDEDGALLGRLKRAQPSLALVVMSGREVDPAKVSAVAALRKPWRIEELVALLERVLSS